MARQSYKDPNPEPAESHVISGYIMSECGWVLGYPASILRIACWYRGAPPTTHTHVEIESQSTLFGHPFQRQLFLQAQIRQYGLLSISGISFLFSMHNSTQQPSKLLKEGLYLSSCLHLPSVLFQNHSASAVLWKLTKLMTFSSGFYFPNTR